MRKAFTLVELLFVLTISLVVVTSLGALYRVGVSTMERTPERTNEFREARNLNERVTRLLSEAYLSSDATDSRTYFVATDASGAGEIANSLTFTSTGIPIDSAALDPDDERTFEERNERFGSQGGVAEVSFSLEPVGADAQGSGLFLRTQKPADGDITQGGEEELLIADATSISLEFWNGNEWVTAWDTRTGQRRIPAAIRLSVSTSERENAYAFVAACKHSDITQLNPLTQESGT